MYRKKTSARLKRALSRPMENFLWYLWDTYHDPDDPEFRIEIEDLGDEQRFALLDVNQSFIQDLGCGIDAEIIVYAQGRTYIMDYA